MSRSYRKPWYKDRNPFMKRYANSVIRKTKNVPDGGAYRKMTDQYSICDYRFSAWPKSRYARNVEDQARYLEDYKKAMRK